MAQAAKSDLQEGLGEKDKWANHGMWPLEKITETKQVWERGRGKLKNSTLDQILLCLRAAGLEQNSSLTSYTANLFLSVNLWIPNIFGFFVDSLQLESWQEVPLLLACFHHP